MIAAICLMLVATVKVPSLVHCEQPVATQTDGSSVPDPSKDCSPPEARQLAILPAPIRFPGRDEEGDEREGGDDQGGHQERVSPQVRWQ